MLTAFVPCFRRRLSINLGFEVCQTDLLDYVLGRGSLSESETRLRVQELASAVTHLHACGVVHLDIKLENIFLDARQRLKLGDLGLASLSAPNTRIRKVCGSGVYAAPEVVLCKTFGAYDARAADVWSVGVCAFVMARGRFPFHVEHETVGYSAYVEARSLAASFGRVIEAPLVLRSPAQRASLSEPLLAFLDASIAFEPANRPTAAQLLMHPWTRAIDCTEVPRGHCNQGELIPVPTNSCATYSCKPNPQVKSHELGNAIGQEHSSAPESPPGKRRRLEIGACAPATSIAHAPGYKRAKGKTWNKAGEGLPS